MMTSLRHRLFVSAAVGTVFIIALSGVSLYALVHAWSLQEFDSGLLSTASTVGTILRADTGTIHAEFTTDLPEEFRAQNNPDYLAILDPAGHILFRSPSLGDATLPELHPAIDQPVAANFTLPDGRPGRAVAIARPPASRAATSPAPNSPPAYIIIVARSTELMTNTLRRLLSFIIGVCVVALLLALGATGGLIRTGLRPVERLAGQIASIDGHPLLARQLNLAQVPRELLPIAQRTNELLAHIEAAFQREKSLSADIAHELRNPLAGLRSNLEVGLARERAPDAYRRFMHECLQITRQMQTMVDNLLVLAQLEAGQLTIHRQPLSARSLLTECLQAFSADFEDRRIGLHWQFAPDDMVSSDPARLRVIFHNLLANAAAYTNVGGKLTLSSSRHPGQYVLVFRNSGSALDHDQAQLAVQRFCGADAARREVGVHCGLGLALADRIAGLLGGSIATDAAVGGDFVVTLILPVGEVPTEAPPRAQPVSHH